ncbi:MAG: hypothetical protein DRQ88_02930 [Epsilonproteobacteria bacterium]|nr:MAG: hypothetical protein DRQ89_01885 [Campylobacterota bacterium]RLA67426.1 MAG: hypothetical protein DRQ88_02930 [Campylobacterota bacterium]
MPLGGYIFLGIELLIVGYIDFTKKKISNVWPILNFLIFIVVAIFFRDNFFVGWEHFLFPLGILAVGFVLFLFKVMGPGDSKFLFSLFLLLPLPDQKIMFLCLIYITISIGSILLLMHLIQNFGKIIMAFKTYSFAPLKGAFGTKFSFAPLILLAWIWYGWKIDILN